MAKNGNKIQWFAFYPQDWMDVLVMDNEQAGARFKELVIRLGKNEAPEGTTEAEMIAKSNEISRIKREAVRARWNKANAEQPTAPPPPPPRPAPRPPQPAQRRFRPPTIEEVYDSCQEKKLPDTFGREWLEWQDAKGWNGLKLHWHFALAAFCQKKLKRGE